MRVRGGEFSTPSAALHPADRFDGGKHLEFDGKAEAASDVLNFDEDQLGRRRAINEPMLASSVFPVADLVIPLYQTLPLYETKTREIAYTIAKPVYETSRGSWNRYPNSQFQNYGQSDYTTWLNTLFPTLAGPAPKPVPPKISEGHRK